MRSTVIAKIEAIDKQVSELIKKRNALAASLQSTGKTEYFSGKPKRPGVYHTSTPSRSHLGGGRGRWDGKQWSRFLDWGDYSTSSEEIVWHGEGKDSKQPIDCAEVLR